MPSIFIPLPAPGANGSGAWTDVSTMGAEKEIVVGGDLHATITFEISNEAAASQPAPVLSIQNKGKGRCNVAALWMRATVSGYQSGSAPVIEVGANDDGAQGANIAATAGNGTGAPTDVSALGQFKTVTVGGPFEGNVLIEFSEDGVEYAPVFMFTRPGQQTKYLPTMWMRATRVGIKAGSPTPGLPIVNVACIVDVSPGPGFHDPDLIRYVATGLEGDTITVPLTFARANNAYFVAWMSQSVVSEQAAKAVTDIPRSLRTVNQFVANLAADTAIGDEWEFLVVGG
jgi:hypothetical protein